jgi:kynurenine formamidase
MGIQSTQTTIIDLSHSINSNISVYPGTEQPQIKQLSTVQHEGFAEMSLVLNSHHATHVDAPYHMIEGGKTLDQFTADKFTGTAFVIDCRVLDQKEISIELLQAHTTELQQVDFVLFCTGWSKKWNTALYLSDYPVLSTAAATWLSQLPIKGVGFDAISPDEIDSLHYPNHKILLGKELIIIENLTNLDLLTGEIFELVCLPLKIEQADAAPARAVAILNKQKC